SVLPIIVLSGFRFDVGTDYMYRYFPDFKSIESGVIPYNLEIGYLAIVKLCLLISDNFQLLMVVTSTFIYGFLYYLIYKYSVCSELSIAFFLLGGFYFDSLNIVRQYMAIIVLLFCFYHMAKGKMMHSVLYLVTAVTLHNMAILFVVIYLPVLLKYQIKYIITILGIGLVSLPFMKPIAKLLVSNTRFQVYFEGELSFYTQGDLQIVLCMLNIGIFLVYCYILFQNKNLLKERFTILYCYVQSIAVLLNLVTGVLFIAFRLTYMFSILQIFAIPYLVSQLKEQKEQKMVVAVVGGMYLVSLTYLVVYANGNEVLPYQMRWYVN
ncbi:MAG: EpsG family protein, partial [Eubacteriales bacterium]